MFSKECKAHLKEANMGPLQHAKFAISIALQLQIAVFAIIIHSIVPRCCKTYASDKIIELADRFREMKDE
jgi:hypothetical protein